MQITHAVVIGLGRQDGKGQHGILPLFPKAREGKGRAILPRNVKGLLERPAFGQARLISKSPASNVSPEFCLVLSPNGLRYFPSHRHIIADMFVDNVHSFLPRVTVSYASVYNR